MLNGKLSQIEGRAGGNGTHGSVLPPYTGFRAGVSKYDAAAVLWCCPRPLYVSGRLHFGQVLCARHGMSQLRLGFITLCIFGI